MSRKLSSLSKVRMQSCTEFRAHPTFICISYLRFASCRACESKCEHSCCDGICSEDCNPCTMPCTWACPHKSCSALCGELCTRLACDLPCSKKLRCGHPCAGMCGEAWYVASCIPLELMYHYRTCSTCAALQPARFVTEEKWRLS
jgi:hypothetical protein